MKPIVISVVSYLNALPFVYGLQKSNFDFPFTLRYDTPAESAEALKSGDATIGLLPVGAFTDFHSLYPITNFGIGCTNDVATVALFSQKPIEEITKVFLDYQSRSSAKLIQILSKHHWKKDFEFIQSEKGFINQIKQSTGGLIIGDRAIKSKQSFPFLYDLGAEWFSMTSLPFVFARWVSTKQLDPSIEEQLSAAFQFGIDNKLKVAQKNQHKIDSFSLETYYTKYIDYELTINHKKGMQLYQELAGDAVLDY